MADDFDTTNLDDATADLKLNPQEQALYRMHLQNLWGSGGVDNPDGSRSSLYQSVQEHNGRFYNVPTVWNGKREAEPYTNPRTGETMDVPNATALKNIDKAGWDTFPSYDTPDEADQRYNDMHGYMEKDTAAYMQQRNDAYDDAPSFADGGPVPDFDDIPSFDDMPDQPQQQASGGQLMFDDLPSFDDMQDQSRPQAEGELKTFGREAAHAAAPAAGGFLAGAGTGALIGAAGGNPLTVAGGAIVGGLVGAYGVGKVQEAGLEALGMDDSQQRAANEEVNPKSAFAGQMAPALAFMRPDKAASLATRGISAGLMGGIEAGQEAYSEGTVSPGKVLAAAGAGAALPSPNRVGGALEGVAQRVAGKVAGRPNVAANPDAGHAQDEAASSQQPPNEGESAFQQPPPSVAGDTVGNPQSAPTRSERTYTKDQAKPAGGDTLTQGQIRPDVQAALDAFSNYKPPAAPNPNDIDQSLKSAPVETGFPRAASGSETAPQAAPTPAAPPMENLPQSNAAEPGNVPGTFRTSVTINGKNAVAEGNARVAPEGAKAAIEAVHPDVQKVAEVRDDVAQPKSPEQAEAGNYAKGHPGRLFGREVSIETPKGGVREDTKNDPPAWRVENFPYDYGEFLGTKGADNDRVDLGVVGTGDRHFVVDQKDPATGKFDEHKVMAYAADPADALDHYYRGFTDGSGPDRVGSIKEATADELKAWLAKPGKKRDPYDPAAFKDAGATPAGLTEGEKPLRKVTAAVIDKMRENGVAQDKIDAYLAKPVGEQLALGQKYLRDFKSSGNVARPDRIRGAVPTVEGIKDDEGNPITARSKADATRKSADVKTMNDAYDKFGKDVELPATPEDKAALRARAQQFADDTAKVTYKPNVKHAPYLLQRAAKKLLLAKNPSDRSWQEFVGTAKQLASGDEAGVRAAARAESDIALNRRGGEEAIAGAEAKSAGTNTTEDEMIAALDRARESEFEGDIPHEEAEAMVHPERVAAASDLQRVEGAKDHIDLTEAGGRKELAEKLKALPKSKKQPAEDRFAPTKEGAAASEGRVLDVKSLPADYLKSLAEGTKKPKATTRLDTDEVVNMLKDKSPTIRGLGDAFMRDTEGALKLDKIMSDLRAKAAQIGSKEYWKRQPHKSYIARDAKSIQEEYARSLSDRLFQLRQGDVEHQIGLKKWVQSLPKGLNNPKTLERLYYAREADNIGMLDPHEQQLYEKFLKPVFEQNDTLYKNIADIDPWRLGPKVENHIYRITKGDTDEYNMFKKGESTDPIEGINAIATASKGTMLGRRFFAFEDKANGNRFVASHNDDGYTIWHNRKPIKVVDPSFEYKPGGEIKVGSRDYAMKEATTPEIEQHALFDIGKKAEYYHNAALSAGAANYYLGAVARHLQFLHNLKSDADFRRFAVPPGAKAPDNFVTTSLANFKDWKMDPQLAHVLNDYGQPGINADAINTLRQIAQGITKTIFWMPTAHAMNVAAHWFVGRGFRWLPFTGGYKSLAEDGLRAIKSVVSQDELQTELRRAGAGTIYGGVLSQGLMDNLARGLGEAVEKNPSKWDPIARQFGIGPSDLAKAVYKASSRVMWAANDMFLTHAILENQRMGMSLQEAITHAERHIPNYRIPATVMGSGKGARIMAQIMSEPTLTVFGRYHYGVFNSYANIAKDLTRGNGAAKLDAVGNLFAMGLLAFAVYPVMDKAAQWITGNDKASSNRRGPLAIPSHISAALQGKEDITSAARSTFTLSPLLATAVEQLANKDYRGKDIIERGDVQQAAKGNLRSAGKVAAQEADFLGRGLVSPYSTLSSAVDKGGGVGTMVRDQAADVKNPSAKAIRYDALSTKYNLQHSRQRERSGGGLLEGAYDKATR